MNTVKLDIAVNKVGAWYVIEDSGKTYRYLGSYGSKANAERALKGFARRAGRKIVRGRAIELLGRYGWTQ